MLGVLCLSVVLEKWFYTDVSALERIGFAVTAALLIYLEFVTSIVGGGPGGIMAALASARLHARTLLVERSAFLGGSATLSKIGPISPFHYKDEQVVRGILQEFIDELVKAGGATGHMKCLNGYGTGDYVCIYNHEIYKYVVQRMLLDEGVDILFHAVVSSVIKEGNSVRGG